MREYAAQWYCDKWDKWHYIYPVRVEIKEAIDIAREHYNAKGDAVRVVRISNYSTEAFCAHSVVWFFKPRST